jgi:hypothetical protein
MKVKITETAFFRPSENDPQTKNGSYFTPSVVTATWEDERVDLSVLVFGNSYERSGVMHRDNPNRPSDAAYYISEDEVILHYIGLAEKEHEEETKVKISEAYTKGFNDSVGNMGEIKEKEYNRGCDETMDNLRLNGLLIEPKTEEAQR